MKLLAPGTVLKSRWRVGAKLGEGAMAIVYAVEDTQHRSTSDYVVKCIPLPKGVYAVSLAYSCTIIINSYLN